MGVQCFDAGTPRTDLEYFTKLTTHLYPVTNTERCIHIENRTAEDVAKNILRREGHGNSGNTSTCKKRGDVDLERVENHHRTKTPDNDPQYELQNGAYFSRALILHREEVFDNAHAYPVHCPDTKEHNQRGVVLCIDVQEIRHICVERDVGCRYKDVPCNWITKGVDKQPGYTAMKIAE